MMRKRRSNAMEVGDFISPPRKKKSLCPATIKDREDYETPGDLDYDPIRFLRCHSKTKRDFADISTQVWQCAFEPSLQDPEKTTNYFATCGGNSVCIIDAESKDAVVERKYFADDIREMFYALAWTTLNDETNILAVGGSLGAIHLIHPASNGMFLFHKIKSSSKMPVISSLVFDKIFTNILYCSTEDHVNVYDVGDLWLQQYYNKLSQLHTLYAGSEIIALATSAAPHVLLAAANDGLYCWTNPSAGSEGNAEPLRVRLPPNALAKESGTALVDSVVCLPDGRAATKCALHGCIYVFDLAATVAAAAGGKGADAVVLRTLRWSDTDNYFMNMGFAAGSALLGCGDDQGKVWLYDLETLDDAPTSILGWPDLEDPYLAKVKKLRVNVNDVVVDKVCFDWSGRHLVAVTSNNMVCVWRRVSS